MRRVRVPCVYILTNKPYGTLYVGVTSDLHLRMNQHVLGSFEGFTKRYCLTTLVYYEMHATMPEAIQREKRLKRWNRTWKYRIVEQMNPQWLNLYDERSGEIAFGPAEIERLSYDPLRPGND